MTIYNKALYLPSVLYALAHQEGSFEREFIFIDDGSTDESLAILNAYSPKFLRPQSISQHNQGPAQALNRGLALARHTYIKFMDADDVLLPNASQTLLSAAQRTKADAVFGLKCQGYEPNLSLVDLPHIPPDIPINVLPDPLLNIITGGVRGISSIGSSGGLAKHESIMHAGGCDTNIFIQDYSLSLRLGLKGRFTHIPWVVALTPKDTGAAHLSCNRPQEKYDTLLALYNMCRSQIDLSRIYLKPLLRRSRKLVAQLAKQEGMPYTTHYMHYYASAFSSRPKYESVMQELHKHLEWILHHFGERIRRCAENPTIK